MKKQITDNSKRKTIRLSVVLATRNEEKNIARCLEPVKKYLLTPLHQDFETEIIIFDENSNDKTESIAKSFGADVFKTKHEDNFHITKQKAIDQAKGEWILQLDADERITKELADEIIDAIMQNEEMKKQSLETKKSKHPEKWRLFSRHENLIAEREGGLGKKSGEIVAYFIPRINYFVGKPLLHAGVYPDAVIRLIKKGKARLPAKSVHELMEVDGEVGWMFNDMEHHESPNLRRYIARANRYTSLTAQEIVREKVGKNYWQLFNYSLLKPKITFLKLYLRHKGYKDGMRGFLWSVFSALHWPLAYWKYWVGEK